MIHLQSKFKGMIQRIQTLYLVIAAVFVGLIPFFIPTSATEDGVAVYFYEYPTQLILFMVSAVMSIASIFLYKNRQNQFVLNRLNIILNFILLGLLTFRLLNLPGETIVSVKGIGVMLPIVSIVCLVLANKAIKRDEDLVKSVDRLR
jgi:membrane protease YdiL (CAAX protease family)